MENVITQANQATRTAVTILAILNECLLVTNPWIISPSTSQIQQSTRLHIYPVITTTTYAIAEPLYTYFFLWLSAPPVIAIFSLCPMHIHFLLLLLDVLGPGKPSELSDKTTQAIDASTNMHSSHSRLETHHDGNLDQTPRDSSSTPPSRFHLHVAFFLPVQTAALVNAAFSLFAQSLYAIHPWSANLGLLSTMNILAVIGYLGTKFFDFAISRVTSRALFLGHFGLGYAKSQMACLALLLLVKISVRKMLGLEASDLVGGVDVSRAEELFGRRRYEWLVAFSMRLPWWFSPAVTLGSLVRSLWLAKRRMVS